MQSSVFETRIETSDVIGLLVIAHFLAIIKDHDFTRNQTSG